MDFICSRSEFANGLHLAEYLTNRGSAIPALQGILLETKKDMVMIRSTDLNTGFEMTIRAREVHEEGSTVIPVRPSIQLVSTAGDDTIRVKAVDSAIHFTTSATTSTLKGYPKEDFPTLPTIKEGEHITFSIQDFLKAARAVFFSAGKNEIWAGDPR